MAKNTTRTPQGMAGLQRFSEDDTGRFRVPPEFVIVITLIVVAIVFFLHQFGDRIFGL